MRLETRSPVDSEIMSSRHPRTTASTADAAPTRGALYDALRKRGAETPKGSWVLGRGFDQTRWPDGQMPTADELDAVVEATERGGKKHAIGTRGHEVP